VALVPFRASRGLWSLPFRASFLRPLSSFLQFLLIFRRLTPDPSYCLRHNFLNCHFYRHLPLLKYKIVLSK